MGEKNKYEIVAVRPLQGRSLKLEFSNGSIRLFDGRRLHGPRYIPLTRSDLFRKPVIEEGDLCWPEVEIRCSAEFIYNNSVPYDENARAIPYVPSKKEMMGEKVAVILFPLAAAAGILGIAFWWINQ